MGKLIAPEPAPRGKISTTDIKNAVLTAALVGGLTAVLPVLTAPTIIIGVVLKAFGVGFATGGIGWLVKQLNTNSDGKFNAKEPDAPQE